MMTYQILRGKRWFWLGAIALAIWSSYWAYQNKTLGFSVHKITSTFTYNPELAIEEPKGDELDHLKALFQQKYKFLAVGSQSYAFVSEDGKYVIKFFRMKHLIPRVSDLWKHERIPYQRQNLVSIFTAHKLAYEKLREDSGLVYIHLNKSGHLQTQLKAIDRLGRTHLIDLDQTEFVVQEKAELIFSRLKKLLDQKDQAGVQKAVGSMMELIRRRLDLGISDHDKAVKHNYGFVGDRPVQLDVGRIYEVPETKDCHRHYDRIHQRIEKWLHDA